MKPSIKFLESVERGDVYRMRGYSMKRGGYDKFVGGEKTYEKHRDAGFVNWCPSGSLGKRGVLTLTDEGRKALMESRK